MSFISLPPQLPNNYDYLECPEDTKPEEIMLSYIDYLYSRSNHDEQLNAEMERRKRILTRLFQIRCLNSTITDDDKNNLGSTYQNINNEVFDLQSEYERSLQTSINICNDINDNEYKVFILNEHKHLYQEFHPNHWFVDLEDWFYSFDELSASAIL